MSLTPPPLPGSRSGKDPIAEALRYRAIFFGGAVALVGVALLQVLGGLGGALESKSDPNVLTWALFGFTILEAIIVILIFFEPQRLAGRFLRGVTRRDKAVTLGQAGRQISAIAAAMSVDPALFGFVLFIMSGDEWRMLLFLPVSAGRALFLWRKIPEVIEELSRSGVA